MKQSTFNIEITADDEIEVENPENNFEKVMSIQPDVPSKEYKSLIQSMCENFTFEKSVIKKTSNMNIPSEVKSEIKRKSTFLNYKAVQEHAKFMKNKEHFGNRTFSTYKPMKTEPSVSDVQITSNRKSNRYNSKNPISKPSPKSTNDQESNNRKRLGFLLQGKKNKLLLEESLLAVKQNKVSAILNDPVQRQKIFEEALLIERLYDIEINKQKESKVYSMNSNVPEKFRGVHPRHMRIGTELCKKEEDFHRKKHVYKQRELQFYSHAHKIQSSSMKRKKEENSLVINSLMKYNEQFCRMRVDECEYEKRAKTMPDDDLTQTGCHQQLLKLKKTNIYEQDLKIRKLFLKYSNCQTDNPEEMYTKINQDGINKFFKDFGLQEFLAKSEELVEYIQKQDRKITIDPEQLRDNKKSYKLFDFLEILYIMAACDTDTGKEGSEFDKISINDFLEERIWKNEEKVIPAPWLQLKKIKRSVKYQRLMKISKFEERAKNIFENRMKKVRTTEHSRGLLPFTEILEVAYEVKLFPLIVSKKQLRFYYLYCRTQEWGVKLCEFIDILTICGIVHCPRHQNDKKIKWISDLLAHYT